MLMDSLLNNRDDSEEAKAAFDKAFITLDNSIVTDKLKLVGIIQRGLTTVQAFFADGVICILTLVFTLTLKPQQTPASKCSLEVTLNLVCDFR